MRIIHRYTDAAELTAEILRELIGKIIGIKQRKSMASASRP